MRESEVDQPTPTYQLIAANILASLVNDRSAPTRRERLEVAELSATLAVVDELKVINAAIAELVNTIRGNGEPDRDTFFDEVTH